jgi:hypothetical protein
MKKIVFLSLLFIAFIGTKVMAQEGGDIEAKGFRFGLKAEPSIVWIKPDDVKKYESGGARMKFAYGLMTEFRLGKTASFVTGLEATYSGGKINMLDSVYYIPVDDTNHFYLKDRSYNTTYIGIPIALKMKTPDIGGMTYFGMFGINTAIKTKARAKDEGNFVGTSTSSLTGVDISNEINFLRFDLVVGGGFEYNIAGSTSMVVSVNYHNGLTNTFRGESKSLKSVVNNSITASKLDAKTHYISLTVGILF